MVTIVMFSVSLIYTHVVVVLSLVGSDPSGSDSVQCHTDLSTCCSGAQSFHRGDWYFPNGSRLPIPESHQTLPIEESRREMRVELHRSTATSPVGIYRCGIATYDVHSDTDHSVRETVYVGLYTSGGMLISSLLVYAWIRLWPTITIIPSYTSVSIC